MRKRWGLAFAATTTLVAASAAGEEAQVVSCELATVDRERTSSHRCISCHDGSVGPAVSFEMKTDGTGMSHPVEVEYARAAAEHPEHYVPASQLPTDVPLVEGRVACTSCHDGASSDPKRVARPATLCFACHRL